MEPLIGDEFEISENYRINFFSSKTLTIVSISNQTLQFILNNGKGYGAMPLNHFTYLIKKDALSEVISKRSIVEEQELEDNERIS